MAAAVLGLGCWAVRSPTAWRFDATSVALTVMAAIPLLQAAAGLYTLPDESPLVSLYLAGFALTLAVARHAEEKAPGRTIEALLAGLFIAALVSTGLALYQWLGGDSLGILAAPIPYLDRPVANVGQPNNLATLLVWGLIATWWAHLRGRIGSAGAVLAAAFLLVGVTLTQSRAGALQVILLGAVALIARKRLRTSAHAPAFVALAVWWLLCMLALEPLTQAWTEQFIRPMLNTESPRERTMLLKTVFMAIGEHPWVGYGWYQNVPAHVAVADRYAMHGLIANSHNIVLDLIVWNGLPLGLAITAGLCFWYWRTARRAVSAEHVLLLLALATFCVHASLELPHAFAYFLVPVAIMMGTLTANLRPFPDLFAMPRAWIAGLMLLLAAILCQLFLEYGRIETNMTDARKRAANIDGAHAAWDPNAFLLSSLQDWTLSLQAEPRPGMSATELDSLRHVVTRYPTSLGLLRYAQASTMNGRPADATWALGVLCSVHRPSECQAAANDWAGLTAEGRPELASVRVPVASPAPGGR